MPIRIDAIIAHRFRIPLTRPFRISVGEVREKEGLLIEVRGGSRTGWGEAAVDGVPFYTSETVDTALALGKRVFGPLMKERAWAHPEELEAAFAPLRGHAFTKTAFECALWDLLGQERGESIAALIGGTREWVERRPSIGIKDSPAKLVEAVAEQLEKGYRQVKIKVRPGADEAYIRAVREHWPDLKMMVDANSAYTPEDIDRLAGWDAYRLEMIEQPLDHDDIYFHRLLCERMATPICLDESIVTPLVCRAALELGSADIVNIKVGRVGGLVNTRRVHDLCERAGVPVWIGSRIGTGVSQAMRMAAASLPNASLPTDAGFGSMYLPDSLIAETFEVRNGCEYRVPQGPGLGIELDRDRLARYTVATEEL
jgi:o-succinylbenzoate synthase